MDMFRTFLTLALLQAAMGPAYGQSLFPTLHGETTEGKSVTLPAAVADGFTIVAVAYGKKAEPLLEKWYAPAYARFVAKHGLFAGSYNAELYLVPIFIGLNKSAYAPTMARLRKEVDADIARRVLFVKDGGRELIEALDMKDKDVPYFFVLDKDGRILKSLSGPFSVDRLDALEAPMLE